MPQTDNIDSLLGQWPYEPNSLCVRIVEGDDGREVIQMRVDLGVLQLETQGRPDGTQPFGAPSILDLLKQESGREEEFVMDDELCAEADREFVQFYHRRICWLKLQQFQRAVEDADHTLALMDFCSEFSPDENWTVSHEQYRPFVLFHRTQAAALMALEDDGPDTAVAEVEAGLDHMRVLFSRYDAAERFDEDELVGRLRELREALLDRFDERSRLGRELEIAIEAEHYEEAARIRDQLADLEKSQ